MFVLAPAAYAAPQKHFSIGSELFHWQEFSPTGNRYLSEHGLRYNATITANDRFAFNEKLSYQILLRGYLGSIDYDGQTQPGNIFVSSTADYAGWNAELSTNYHYPASGHHTQHSIIAAIGIDHWLRDLQNSIDAIGNPVSGIQEEYQIIYGRLGLQLDRPEPLFHSTTRLGIKYPFSTNEKVDSLGIELEPGRQGTFFASYRGTLGREEQRPAYIEISYEAYRFDASEIISGWQQPESHQDIISISLGVAF